MNYLWGGMILIGVVYGAFTGNLSAVTEAALSSAKDAVSLCIAMAGAMAFWVGIMKIAEESDIIQSATDKLRPVLSLLFPNLPKNHNANKYIATNCIANIFGLGWAATPAGLKAMESLKELDPTDEASDEMCTFLVLNISSLQLIPVNVIAYRSQYGSLNPSSIIGPAILATCISTLAGILFCKIAQKCGRKKRVNHH